MLARGWSWTAAGLFVAFLIAIEVLHEFGYRLDGSQAKVVNCYEFFNQVLHWNELLPDNPDLTEGLWEGNPSKGFDQAHQDKVEWLLDSAECGPGVRVLEVGCGNGNLLAGVAAQGGVGVGITLSPSQAESCRRKGLRAEVCDFWALDDAWDGGFDAIVFNGPLEHFHSGHVGESQQRLYDRLFERCARLLDKGSRIRRVVITCVHMRMELSYTPINVMHLYLIERTYGGCYPIAPEGLVGSAAPHFDVLLFRDSPQDYYLTSVEWLRRMHLFRATSRPTAFAKDLARVSLLKVPYWLHKFVQFLAGSWLWQFDATRQTPPMQHLWFVLKARESRWPARNA